MVPAPVVLVPAWVAEVGLAVDPMGFKLDAAVEREPMAPPAPFGMRMPTLPVALADPPPVLDPTPGEVPRPGVTEPWVAIPALAEELADGLADDGGTPAALVPRVWAETVEAMSVKAAPPIKIERILKFPYDSRAQKWVQRHLYVVNCGMVERVSVKMQRAAFNAAGA